MSRVVEEHTKAMKAWAATEWESYEAPTEYGFRYGVRHRTLEQRPCKPKPAYRTLEGYDVDEQHPLTLDQMWEWAEGSLMGAGIACFLTMDDQQRAFDECAAEIERVQQYRSRL